MTFYIGDKVLCTGIQDNNDYLLDKSGIIIDILDNYSYSTYTVEFFAPFPRGHTGENQKGRAKCCWDIHPDNLTLVKEILTINEKVTRKSKILWNNSNFVKTHPSLAY